MMHTARAVLVLLFVSWALPAQSLVADINQSGFGRRSWDPKGFAPLGAGRFVFSAFVDGKGSELFVTDGTAAGTKLVADLWPKTRGSTPEGANALGARVSFRANHPTVGRELFMSDGTRVQLVKDLWPGTLGSNPAELTAFAGRLFFAAGTRGAGYRALGDERNPARHEARQGPQRARLEHPHTARRCERAHRGRRPRDARRAPGPDLGRAEGDPRGRGALRAGLG